MNFHQCLLEPLVIDRSHVNSALQSFIHMILLNRALGPIRTRDSQCPDLDLQYTMIDDPNLIVFVDKKVEESVKMLDTCGSGTVSLKFYQRRLVKTLFLTTKEDKIVWEHWSLPVQLRNWIPKDLPAQFMGAYIPLYPMVKFEVEQLLKDHFIQILHLVNESQYHLPPVPGTADSPLYPVDLDFVPCSSDEFWTASLKRIISNGPPKFT